MKRMLCCVFAFVFMFVFASCGEEIPEDSSSEQDYYISCPESSEEISEESGERQVINYKYVKAVWVSQFDLAPILCLGEGEYTAAVRRMVTNIKAEGLNTVIMQIRPYGDSFYRSAYYPTSRFCIDCDYDPVDIFVEECHGQGLSVHAWINPYRLETAENMASLQGSAIRDLYSKGRLCFWEGRYYLNPSGSEEKRLICDGAREALSLYDFDGLHMDDYFYPTSDESFDEESFKASGESDLRTFRENNVNDLVKKLYAVTKAVDKRLLYGISPAGNINSVRRVYYADVEKWCSEDGYIDYIMPQIYFGFLHASCPFDKMVDAWGGIVKNPNVRLIIGITLSKACSGEPDGYAGTDEGKNEWLNHNDVIARSLEHIYSSKYCSGLSLFCYQYLYNPLTGAENKALSEEKHNFAELLK